MTIHKTNAKAKEDFSYEIIEDCGVIGKKGNNTIRLRYISYNGAEPKYDIREGYEKDGEEHMGKKGITLTGEQLENLVALVQD